MTLWSAFWFGVFAASFIAFFVHHFIGCERAPALNLEADEIDWLMRHRIERGMQAFAERAHADAKRFCEEEKS